MFRLWKSLISKVRSKLTGIAGGESSSTLKVTIDPNIEWPLFAFDRLDPDCSITAIDTKDLGQYMEYWNSPLMPDSDSWEVLDAKQRRVLGRIEHLQVLDLHLEE